MIHDKIYSYIKEKTLFFIEAIKESGNLFKGLGVHYTHFKMVCLGRVPSTSIMPHSILAFDTLLAGLAFFISIYISLGFDFFEYSHAFVFKNLCVFMLITASVFMWMQIHKTLWRYFSIEDCAPLALAVLLTTLLYLPLMILLSQQETLPKAFPFINFLVFLGFLCLPRYVYRLIYEYNTQQKEKVLSEQAIPVLLVGTGHSTDVFIQEVLHSPALSFEPIGILSPNNKDKGRRIHSVPILKVSSDDDIQKFINEIRNLSKRPQQIIITQANLPKEFLYIIQLVAKHSLLPMMQMVPQFSIVSLSEQNKDQSNEDNEIDSDAKNKKSVKKRA